MRHGWITTTTALFLLLACCWTAGTATAQVASKAAPAHVMPYEGYLTDIDGTPLPDGLYDFTFTLYTTPEGGTPIWTEEHRQISVKNGLIQLELGSGEHPMDLPFDQPYYLSVRVGGEAEMGPRLTLPTAAYSFRARMADAVPPASITDEHIQSVSWDKITDVPERVLADVQDGDGVDGTSKAGNPNQSVQGNPPGGVPSNVWSLKGNRGTNPDQDFLGTTDGRPIVFRTGDEEQLRIQETGIDVASDLTVDNDLTIANDLTVGHEATVANDLTVDQNATVANNLTVGHDVAVANDLTVDQNATVTKDLTVNQNATVTKDLTVGGTSMFESTTTSGNATFNGGTEFENINVSTLTVLGAAQFNNSLTVTGLSSVNTLTAEGAAQFNNSLNVTAPSGVGVPISLMAIHESTHTELRIESDPGRVVISSNKKGEDSQIGSYPLLLNGSDQGMAIKLSGSNVSHNFVSFFAGEKMQGRIEGVTVDEFVNPTINPFYDAKLALSVVFGVAEIAALANPFEVSPIISLAGDLVQVGLELAEGISLHNPSGVMYQSGAGDYAEWLERLDPNEDIAFGDIVGVFGGKISKKTEGAEQIMSVSYNPIVLGNMPVEGEEHLYEKVAFMGQVPVKLIGPVQEGDFIIPSGLDDGTGVAVPPEMMTADEFAKVIGRAWSSSSIAWPKYVNVVVGLSARDVAVLVQKQQAELSALKAALAQRDAEMDALRGDVEALRGVVQDVQRLEVALAALAALPAQTEATHETAQNNRAGDPR